METAAAGSTSEALTILDAISLRVTRGETLAIVGASGSGKSTLLALLAGLDTPSSGTIALAGQELTGLDEDGRARLRAKHVGFVFQSFQLLPHLTALENVMLPLELAGSKDAKRAALDLLERVGLSQRTAHYPKHLSGGEQQRVALARAFAGKPAILFADEPTGNLDAATGEKIIELLFALNRDLGTTLVMVTHDDEIAARCARQVRITAGKIAHDSGPAACASSLEVLR